MSQHKFVSILMSISIINVFTDTIRYESTSYVFVGKDSKYDENVKSATLE